MKTKCVKGREDFTEYKLLEMVHECFSGLGWVDLNGKCLLCLKNSPCKSTKGKNVPRVCRQPSRKKPDWEKYIEVLGNDVG